MTLSPPSPNSCHLTRYWSTGMNCSITALRTYSRDKCVFDVSSMHVEKASVWPCAGCPGDYRTNTNTLSIRKLYRRSSRLTSPNSNIVLAYLLLSLHSFFSRGGFLRLVSAMPREKSGENTPRTRSENFVASHELRFARECFAFLDPSLTTISLCKASFVYFIFRAGRR